MIATQATMASQPTERVIQVQTAACAIVRMLILAVLRIPIVTLISSFNRSKRGRLVERRFCCGVTNRHHWGGGIGLGAARSSQAAAVLDNFSERKSAVRCGYDQAAHQLRPAKKR
jgi:hypothetical protein